MKVMKSLSLMTVTLCLTGCAAMAQMQQQWIAQNCNKAAAYNAGMTAGLTPGSAPNPDYAQQCPINNLAINAAYLEGYRKGVSARPTEINVNTDGRRGYFHRSPFACDPNPPPFSWQ